uniref:BRCT domain-containing protein n=1 Tax=Kwoniella dejecticola CBS 10117 TaxID=1296121 RepID=A0A1A5ZZX8_9TREE|nr:uncharacterized protein I303_06929 [Kwoniella dejecticola CBS 10117]OBR83364.1 hypothetical protein I303_06929 [Kwoniella dejecticola CBS 10117]
MSTPSSIPRCTWLNPPPPPLDKQGKKLFEGESFFIIPYDRLRGTKEGGPSSEGKEDDALNSFITDRAGGVVVPFDQADHILIRHPSISKYAQTIEPNIARRLLHFDWVLDSLCSGQRQSQELYWAIPRTPSPTLISTSTCNKRTRNETQKVGIVNIELSKDPRSRKSFPLSGPSNPASAPETRPRAISAQTLSKIPLRIDLPYHDARRRVTLPSLTTPKTSVPWFPDAQPPSSLDVSLKDLYRRQSPDESEILDNIRRRIIYPDTTFRRAEIFFGISFYVVGPTSARRNVERKIADCRGEIVPFQEDSTVLIMIYPVYSADKRDIYRHFDRARRQRQPAITEGWVHDCHSTRTKLSQDPYLVQLQDLETLDVWKRIKDRRLITVRNVSVLPVKEKQLEARPTREWSSETVAEVDELKRKQQEAARAYGTPISPSVSTVNTSFSVIGKEVQQSVTSEIGRTDIIELDTIENQNSGLKRKLELTDSDLDICCTDPEDEHVDEQPEEDDEVGEEVNVVLPSTTVSSATTIQDSAFYEVIDLCSDSDSDNDLFSERSEQLSAIIQTSKKAKIDAQSDSLKRTTDVPTAATRRLQRQENKVREEDLPNYHRLVDRLREQIARGGIPKGGTRKFAAGFGLAVIDQGHLPISG